MVGIYYCSQCSTQLDKRLIRYFGTKGFFKSVRSGYADAYNYVMATGNFDPNWFLAFVRIPCYCGKEYLAIFRTRFDLDNDPRLEPGDFNLVHVEGTTFAPLDGVYSGLHVRNILGCFLRRWNVMADHIIVCTPFISSDFTKGEWEWLFKHASS